MPGGGEGGRDLLADDAALAHARDHHAPGAGEEDLDGAVEARVDAGQEVQDGLGLDLEHPAGDLLRHAGHRIAAGGWPVSRRRLERSRRPQTIVRGHSPRRGGPPTAPGHEPEHVAPVRSVLDGAPNAAGLRYSNTHLVAPGANGHRAEERVGAEHDGFLPVHEGFPPGDGRPRPPPGSREPRRRPRPRARSTSARGRAPSRGSPQLAPARPSSPPRAPVPPRAGHRTRDRSVSRAPRRLVPCGHPTPT